MTMPAFPDRRSQEKIGMSNTREEKIRQRAHALWEREGRPHGAHDRHWHQATSEVDAEDATAAGEPAAGTKSSAKAKASTMAAAPAKVPKAAQPAAARADASAPKSGRKATKGAGA